MTSKHLLNEQMAACGVCRGYFMSVDDISTPDLLSHVLHEILGLIYIFYPKLHNYLGSV